MPGNDKFIKIANNRLITTERRYWTASIAGLLVVWLIWPHLPAIWSITAGAALVLAPHILSVITYLYHRDEDRDLRPDYWERWLFIGNVTAGTICGVTAALLYLSAPSESRTTLVMAITLLIGAWSTANVPSLKCVYGVFLSATLPVMLAIALRGNLPDAVSGVMLVLFFLALVKHARLVSGAYRASVEQMSGFQKLANSEAERGEIISQDYARLRQFLDSVPLPVVVSSRTNGMLIYVNRPALDLIGINDLKERPGLKGADFFADPADRETAVSQLTTDGVAAVEFRLKRPDGSHLWVFYTARMITYQGEPAVIGSFTDVTARRQAEEELRKSEKKFRLLADHANDLISIYSLQGICLYCSPSIERVLGYHPDEFTGQPLDRFAEPEDVKLIYSLNAKSMETGIVPPPYTFRIRHKQGHWEWMEGSSTVEKDPETGQFTQVSSVSRLVTERVRNERELREARERAESSDRAKSDFLAHMSHEIRTPLNAVIGFSEVMRDELFGPLGSPRYLEYINDIYNSGTHLLELINDVLDLSKIEAGKFELQEDRINLDTIIDTSFRFMRERADAKLISLQSRLHALPDVWCDRRVLTQVMLNLIGNAIKFTPERGSIVVESILDADGNLVLTVTDTGIGIAAEDIATVMQPFGQARSNSDIASTEPGTGLGLPLSRSFVEKHGGTLEITSEPGIGTRVSVVIPASRVMNEGGNTDYASAAR